MATHDYVIANASGAAVRSDLNNALAAIVSNNSNATAPATTYAFMWWYDTTNGQLKQRNADNDAWITVPTWDEDGRLLVGTSTSLDLNAPIQAASTTFAFQGFRYNTGPTAAGATLDLARSNNGTVGTTTAVTAGQGLGIIRFRGAGNGSSFVTGAQIEATAESGTISASSMPTRLTFSTTADGASSPTERFRINNQGAAIFYYNVFMTAVYSTAVTGRDVYINVNGQLGYLSSTRASKTNIQDLGTVDWLYSLNPKSFNYRKKDDNGAYTDEFEEEVEYGLIAEEVELEAPNICFYNETEDGEQELAGISYRKLITPLIKAVQELKTENEALQTTVANLETRLAALEGAN